jgi:recombinational DNA repair protein (RecF pathway)
MYCKCGNRIDYNRRYTHRGDAVCEECYRAGMRERWRYMLRTIIDNQGIMKWKKMRDKTGLRG